MTDEIDMAENTNEASSESSEADAPAPETSLFNEATGDTDEGNTAEESAETAEPEGTEKADAPVSNETDSKGEPEGAPEKYELQAPEGFELDKGVSDAFAGVAKKLGLTQSAAQKVISDMTPALALRQAEQLKQVSETFVKRTMSDQEIGGTNWAKAQRDVARIRDAFGKNKDGSYDADILEFLRSPMGNHPGVLKLFARAGRAFGEGGFPRGRGSANGKISARDIYRNTKI